MADLRYQSTAPARGRAAEIDQGLRSYMLGVYNYMALGVAATAIITLFVASTPALLALSVSLKWVFFIGILGMGFPPFRGGALRYIDTVGVAEFVALADKYAELGALYHPTEKTIPNIEQLLPKLEKMVLVLNSSKSQLSLSYEDLFRNPNIKLKKYIQ